MSKKSEKLTPVKISVINVIYKAMMPSFYKLNSLAEDIFSNKIQISETEKAGLLEAVANASTLKIIFEDYLQQSKEHSVDTLYIPQSEFKSILTMTKLIEASNRISFANTGIWSH